MTRRSDHRLSTISALAACLLALLSPPCVISASSPPADSVHFCAVFDYEQWLRDNPLPAGKLAAERNVGPPRTVRLFYFLPNDRPFRQEVVDSMKTVIRLLQSFYAEQMQAHGYGDLTFRYETDAGGFPLVHRVDGDFPDGHYYDNTVGPVIREVQDLHDERDNVQFIVVDNDARGSIGLGGNRIGGAGGVAGPPKRSGYVMVPADFSYDTAAHELTHGFGLNWHDFRDRSYVLSYGSGRRRLSDCSAGFLAVNPFFNPNIPLDWSTGPEIERVSPSRYPAASKSVPVRIKAADPEGLQHVILQVLTTEISITRGSAEVKACLKLDGETETVVEFEYDGVVPSSTYSTLPDRPSHYLRFAAIDKDGDDSVTRFGIAQNSPYLTASLVGRSSYVSSVDISPDGATLAAGSGDSTVVLWDMDTHERIDVLGGHSKTVSSVAFSPDGSLLAAGTQDGTIMIWDIVTREAVPPVEKHSGYIADVAFSPDGKTLAAAGWWDDTVKLWDVATREVVATLQMPTHPVLSVSFSSDGNTLASSSGGAVLLWDMATRDEVATLEHSSEVRTVAFSPDGAMLAVSVPGAHSIVLWDVATRRKITSLQGGWAWVNSMAFSPDGSTLALGTTSGTAELFNVLAEKLEQAFPHTAGGVASVRFTPDGATLASASSDGIIELWNTSEWLRPRPFRLAMISGDGQQAAPGAPLESPFVVEVRDQNGNPLPDVPVTFTVTAGNGTLGKQFTVERAITDTGGRAKVFLTLGPVRGTNTVKVTLGGRELAVFHSEGVGSTVDLGERDFRSWHLPDGAFARLGKGRISGGDHAVDISSNGRFLAVTTDLGVWVHELASSLAMALLPTERAARSVSFTPDGKTLALGYGDKIALWDVETRRRIGTMDGKRLFLPIAVFSPDGTTLAAGSNDGTVHVWDMATQRSIAVLEGHTDNVKSVAFSPDGTMLASGSADQTIRLWDVNDRKEIATLQGHNDVVKSIAFSPDSRVLASGSWDRTARLWDLANKETIATLNVGRLVTVVFSPDGRTLTTGTWRTMVHWDVATRERVASLDAHRSWISSLAYSPDGTILVSGSSDGTVMLRYVGTGSAARFPGFMGFRTMGMSPDGLKVAVGTEDGTILQWDLETRSAHSTLESIQSIGPVRSLAYSPDGTILASSASSSGDETVILWDTATQDEIATLHPKRGAVSAISFSPDGYILASGMGDGSVKMLDLGTREVIASLDGHAREITSVAISPDGNTLASASFDMTVRLWDVAARSEIATLTGHANAVTSIAFSPDGSILASGAYDNKVKIWDVESRKEIATLRQSGEVHSVAFSPEGTTLAAGLNRNITLWDLATRVETATLEGHSSSVSSLVFSPDGSTLIRALGTARCCCGI